MRSKVLHIIAKRIAERQSRDHYKDHWKADIERSKNYSNKKGWFQQYSEKKELKKYWGCLPLQYYRYGFYKKECTLSVDEMKQYVPNYFAYFIFFPRIFLNYMQLCRDKSLTHTYLRGLNISQPNLILKYFDGRFYSPDNKSITTDFAFSQIENSGAKKIFVKPNFGMGGKDIVVFSLQDGIYKSKAGETLDKSFVNSHMANDSFVIQTGLIQDEEMNAIYSGAINTCRIITKVKDGKSQILFSLLRMGQHGSEIDNASQGGLFCRIDSETGQLYPTAFSNDRKQYYFHGDSNVEFAKTKVPKWDIIKEFILTVAIQFREISVVGWDVALTTDGPVIIEINEGPGLETVQDLYGGVKDLLEIGDPKNWWNYDRFTTVYEL